jgi:adenylosuccinate synthase
LTSKTLAVVGLQWGDEGKGKIVDYFSSEFDWAVRFQGGPNAGHTVYLDKKKIVFHHIPSAVTNSKTKAIMAQGMVLDLAVLKEEVRNLLTFGINIKQKLFISEKAHIILPIHREEDRSSLSTVIGTTASGVGPCYKDKFFRIGLRVVDVLNNNKNKLYTLYRMKNCNVSEKELENIWESCFLNVQEYKDNIVDTALLIREIEKKNESLLFECAQGTFLDIDFGAYPYVTSSHTTVAGITAGIGVPLKRLDEVCGVMKCYSTRVGGGPFVSEEKGLVAKVLREKGNEFGSTTGRPRRCGWLDFVALKYAVAINNVSYLAVTKLDVLSDIKEVPVVVAYKIDGKEVNEYPSSTYLLEKVQPEYKIFPGWNSFDFSRVKSEKDLPSNLRKYIDFIEEALEVPVRIMSFGVEKTDVIFRG